MTTEYTFTPYAGQCANSTKLTITINSSTVTPTFNLIAPVCQGTVLNPLPTKSLENINGVWSPALNNLMTTEYTFTPDAGQCSDDYQLKIIVNPEPKPILSNGAICIDKTKNTLIKSYILNSKLDSNKYDFEWSLNGTKISSATKSTFEVKKVGDYSLIVTDKTSNCVSKPVNALITENNSSPKIEIQQTESFSDNATITISVLNEVESYSYQLDQEPFQSSNIFTGVNSGKHTLTIKDLSGCTNVSREIVVIGYPKFFTPNGDSFNDTWNVIGLDKQTNAVIYIFDRYGKFLRQLSPSKNGWDGTYNGRDLPSTDYWFKVIYLENKINKEFKSHFSLIR